jgi:hypothetical protein
MAYRFGSTIDAVLATGTQVEAADLLGITEREFGRMRIRLRQVGKCFLNDQSVRRQRKPYKKHIARTKKLSASRLAA